MTQFHQITSIDNLREADDQSFAAINIKNDQHLKQPLTIFQSPECRICLQQQLSMQNPLISPCLCSGSVQLVHFKCISNWIMRTNHPNDTRLPPYTYGQYPCQMCKEIISYKMDIETKCRPKQQVPAVICYSLGNFVVLLLLMVICFALLAYDLSAIFKADTINNGSSHMFEILVLSAAAVLLLFISLLCLYFLISVFFLKKYGTIIKINQFSKQSSPQRKLELSRKASRMQSISTVYPLQMIMDDTI